MSKEVQEIIVAPDLKRPFDATIPSLPKAAMILPAIIYLWILFSLGQLGYEWFQAHNESKQYPSDIATKQQLDSKITAYETVLSDADKQFENFRYWKGWLLEGPPMAQLAGSVFNAIQPDVRITTLRFVKTPDYPTQLELTCRLALTQTDPTKQFELVMQGLNNTGWRVGGSVDQGTDPDAARLYPTPNGAPREVFYKLEAKLNQKIDAKSPNVPITVAGQRPAPAAPAGAPPAGAPGSAPTPNIPKGDVLK